MVSGYPAVLKQTQSRQRFWAQHVGTVFRGFTDLERQAATGHADSFDAIPAELDLERTVIRWLYGRPLETLLATWGISLILMQTVRTLFGAQNVAVENPAWLSGGWALLPNLTLPYNRLAILVFAALVLAGMALLIARTRLGLFVRGVTQNRRMAACVGVNTARVDTYAFALGSGDRRAGAVVGGLVASHWLLDFLTHRPDLPLSPWGGPKVGLGLWNHPAATVLVEGAIFAAGVWLYAKGTRPLRRSGTVGLWSLVAFLVAMAGANQLSVPPGEQAVAWGTLSMWLIVLWMAWVDRNRQPFSGVGGRAGAAGVAAPGSPP